MSKIYKAKGRMTFCLTKKGIKCCTATADDYKEEYKGLPQEYFDSLYEVNEYDFIDGLEFLKCVKDGSFINSDGSISCILVDGHVSNLGITCEGFMKGSFLVDEHVFRDVCSRYKVIVNWANK